MVILKKKRLLFHLTLLLCLLFLTSCSRELSRETAKQILEKNKQKEITEEIRYGGNEISIYDTYGIEQESSRLAVVEGRLGLLRDKGYLTFEKRSAHDSYKTETWLEVDCSPKLEPYAIYKPEIIALELTLAKPTIKEVTGIAKVTKNVRIVEYSLNLNPTPLYDVMGSNITNLQRKARFILYDDGWRLDKDDI